MRTIALLVVSNCFMTYAWYGHLKSNMSAVPLWKLVLVSWGVAFFEYLFMVPANNIYGRREGFSAFQLKTIQEVISLLTFGAFAVLVLKEKLQWNYLAAFICILAAVVLMFYKKG